MISNQVPEREIFAAHGQVSIVAEVLEYDPGGLLAPLLDKEQVEVQKAGERDVIARRAAAQMRLVGVEQRLDLLQRGGVESHAEASSF